MPRPLLLALTIPLAAQTFTASADVGVTTLKGASETKSANEFRITGSGANIWAKADAFQFLYRQVTGDFALTADIAFEGAGVNAHRKAVLMFRQSLDADSAYADVALHGDGLTALQYRAEKGGETKEVRAEDKAPRRVRIERRGNNFAIFTGNPLKAAGTATVALTNPVYLGIGVCSHDATVLETAVFSNVQVEPLRPRYTSKVTIYDLATKRTRVVHTEPDIMEAPNWSRDGKYLITNARGRLYKIPVDGGKAEELSLDTALRANNDHDISADGKWLAISASSPQSRQSQVYVAAIDGSNAKLIVKDAPSYFHGWSPDGKWLAVVANRDRKQYDLYRVPAQGGPEERLTENPAYDDGPDYSRDGKWIYFNSDRGGAWNIWRMPASGAGPGDKLAQQITNDEWEDWFPHPSPDGKRLLFFSFPKGTTGHNDRMPGVRLRMTKPQPNAKIETLVEFFGGQGTINVNSWSPDSKRFAFVVYEPFSNSPTPVRRYYEYGVEATGRPEAPLGYRRRSHRDGVRRLAVRRSARADR